MDETVMMVWVDKILVPHVATAPDDVIPLLILNSYHCHMMSCVVQKMNKLGVKVKHILGGCISLCQPINVGFNKSFKDCMQRQRVLWMINKGVIHSTMSPPMRLDVEKWVKSAMAEMNREG
jgi:hypothetical protein